MFIFAITLVCSFAIVLCVIVTLLKVTTVHYRLYAENIIALLDRVLSGQATESDWSVFIGMPIRHDQRLEAIRQRCALIEQEEYTGLSPGRPFLFSRQGLEQLKAIQDELKTFINRSNSSKSHESQPR